MRADPVNATEQRIPTLEQVAPGAWRTVCLLTVIYLVGTLDRSIASLLVPVIKTDLALSDIEISLIQGLAFGLFFMLASPLMGWLVDRYDRRAILFGGLTVWSFAAIGSGLSRTFGTLFTARAVVGGCEASINPTAYAMLSKLFPAKRLSLPMSIFVLGGNLGTGLSFVIGGAVVSWVATSPPIGLPLFGHLAGWQAAFIVTGLPGLLFAPLIWTAVDDRSTADKQRDPTTFADLWGHIRRHHRFFVTHNLGFAMIMAFIVGLQSWNSAF
ncbi:MAG TPA: MFS transporter, partial [Sphingomicrobium sp.]|nr:MFS transporter [Sphingomicrobium sp.]